MEPTAVQFWIRKFRFNCFTKTRFVIRDEHRTIQIEHIGVYVIKEMFIAFHWLFVHQHEKYWEYLLQIFKNWLHTQ